VTKREKVICLLEHMHDWIPGPRTATGSIVQSASTPGETPSKTIDCPICKGTGKRGREVCDECDRGIIVVDDYTGRVAGAKAENAATVALERRERRAKRDREIERLHSQTYLRAADLDVQGDAYTSAVEAKVRQDRSGSFRELYSSIDRLSVEWPAHARALALVYGPDTDQLRGLPLNTNLTRAAEHAVGILAAWMPDDLRVPHWLVGRQQVSAPGKGRWANPSQQVRRNERIYAMKDAGCTVREIGLQVGLDSAQVSRILQAWPVATQGMVA
jgi:hypothetical protein